MKVEAARARREGVLLSKHQRDTGWVTGTLSLSEERDAELHRICRVAHLRLTHGGEDVPPLFDATVIEMRGGWMTITGFERVYSRVPGKIVSYQQSWFICPVQAASGPAS